VALLGHFFFEERVPRADVTPFFIGVGIIIPFKIIKFKNLPYSGITAAQIEQLAVGRPIRILHAQLYLWN